MKLAASAFLSGAKSRLLPASIPFRYFGTAVAFHLLAWVALLAGADELPRFAGGLGWPLAALHLVTLGTLAMSAMGASVQLLPVATRQPLRSTRAPALLWWLATPGVALLALGMGLARPALLSVGAAAVAAALVGFGALLAANLSGARGMPGIVAHGWGALLGLAVLLASALSLAAGWIGWNQPLGRATALALHVPFTAWGFMGLLALGLAYILVPMFALSAAPDERRVRLSVALALAALSMAALAAFGVAPLALRLFALACGGAAVALHLQLMRSALATGMRRELGRSFALVRTGWALLVASLLLAAALVLDAPVPGLPTLFVLVLVGGWLLTFLLGLLQRIVPFLASMHAGGRRPPTPSSLTAARPLAIHHGCHLAALALLGAAVLADSALLARLGALAGLVGAVAYAVFFAGVLRRLRSTRAPAPAPGATAAPQA